MQFFEFIAFAFGFVSFASAILVAEHLTFVLPLSIIGTSRGMHSRGNLPPVGIESIILPEIYKLNNDSGIFTFPGSVELPSTTYLGGVAFGYCADPKTPVRINVTETIANANALKALEPTDRTWCCDIGDGCARIDVGSRKQGVNSRYCGAVSRMCVPCWWAGYAVNAIGEQCGGLPGKAKFGDEKASGGWVSVVGDENLN